MLDNCGEQLLRRQARHGLVIRRAGSLQINRTLGSLAQQSHQLSVKLIGLAAQGRRDRAVLRQKVGLGSEEPSDEFLNFDVAKT